MLAKVHKLIVIPLNCHPELKVMVIFQRGVQDTNHKQQAGKQWQSEALTTNMCYHGLALTRSYGTVKVDKKERKRAGQNSCMSCENWRKIRSVVGQEWDF